MSRGVSVSRTWNRVFYQLRCQSPNGDAWYEAGRILSASDQASETERAALASLEIRLAPFKKAPGRSTMRRQVCPRRRSGSSG